MIKSSVAIVDDVPQVGHVCLLVVYHVLQAMTCCEPADVSSCDCW